MFPQGGKNLRSLNLKLTLSPPFFAASFSSVFRNIVTKSYKSIDCSLSTIGNHLKLTLWRKARVSPAHAVKEQYEHFARSSAELFALGKDGYPVGRSFGGKTSLFRKMPDISASNCRVGKLAKIFFSKNQYFFIACVFSENDRL